MQGFSRCEGKISEVIDIDCAHLDGGIGIRQYRSVSVHVDNAKLRRCLDKTVPANRAVRNRRAVQQEVAVIAQLLAALVEQQDGDALGAKFGKSAPVDGVGLMSGGVNAIDDEGGRLTFNVTDERVFVGEVPVTQEGQETEEVKIPLERHAAG